MTEKSFPGAITPFGTESTATTPPSAPNLSPKLQAASKALDQQIVAAGLSLTPTKQPKPKLAASAPRCHPSRPKPSRSNTWTKTGSLSRWRTTPTTSSARFASRQAGAPSTAHGAEWVQAYGLATKTLFDATPL